MALAVHDGVCSRGHLMTIVVEGSSRFLLCFLGQVALLQRLARARAWNDLEALTVDKCQVKCFAHTALQ